jgi:hypothetical protein
MVPYKGKTYYDKEPGKPLQPGFWIGLALVLLLLQLINQCKTGGVVP